MSQPEERAKKKQKPRDEDDEVLIVCEGQTIEERRELRAELRDIATEISVRGQALQDADKPDFKTIVERNDSAFKKVRYAREAVLEATNFDRLSTAVQKQVQGLATSVRRYNYQDFVKALQQHAEFGSVRQIVDWRKLGAAAGSCFQCVPEIEFMLGPLDKPDAPRKERAKRKKATGGDDDAEEVEPEQLTAKRDKQEDATTKRVKRMKHLIINNIAEPGARSDLPKEIDLFSFVFNPNSFTQTVENMFDMSFQAKEQFAALEMNEEGIPVVRRTSVADDADAAPPPKTSQAVLSFTMEDWKELCEAYGVTECTVENRPGYEPDPVLQKMLSE